MPWQVLEDKLCFQTARRPAYVLAYFQVAAPSSPFSPPHGDSMVGQFTCM